jgi:P-type Mg2+ transporter
MMLIVAIGLALPVTPMAAILGFTRLPGSYLMFLIVMTISYLALVDVAKRQLARRLGP